MQVIWVIVTSFKVLPYLPPLGDLDFDFDVGAELGCCVGGSSDGIHHNVIIYVDHATWKYFMI